MDFDIGSALGGLIGGLVGAGAVVLQQRLATHDRARETREARRLSVIDRVLVTLHRLEEDLAADPSDAARFLEQDVDQIARRLRADGDLIDEVRVRIAVVALGVQLPIMGFDYFAERSFGVPLSKPPPHAAALELVEATRAVVSAYLRGEDCEPLLVKQVWMVAELAQHAGQVGGAIGARFQ